METALTVVDHKPVALDVLKTQVNNIQLAMREVMKEGTHYGKVPGCGDKPTLLKPGAEKICMMFRLLPQFKITEKELANGHREYSAVCALYTPDGNLIAEGVGSCSTMESKYRWRESQRKCPNCGATAIIPSKDFNTKQVNGWLCFGKKGGCGAKFALGDQSIEGQQIGRVENPDLADQYNTVLKMAKKRAHVDATITATAAGDIFTQDIEDMVEAQPVVETHVVITPPKSTQKSTKANKVSTPITQPEIVQPESDLESLQNSLMGSVETEIDYASESEF